MPSTSNWVMATSVPLRPTRENLRPSARAKAQTSPRVQRRTYTARATLFLATWPNFHGECYVRALRRHARCSTGVYCDIRLQSVLQNQRYHICAVPLSHRKLHCSISILHARTYTLLRYTHFTRLYITVFVVSLHNLHCAASFIHVVLAMN